MSSLTVEYYKSLCREYISSNYNEEVLNDFNQIVKDEDVMFAITNNCDVKTFVEATLY